MVNGINSVVNFKELQKNREVPDKILSTQGASAIEQAKSSYIYKNNRITKYNRSVKWCYRRNIGTHRFLGYLYHKKDRALLLSFHALPSRVLLSW